MQDMRNGEHALKFSLYKDYAGELSHALHVV